MESATVAFAARAAHVPFVALRAICDTARTTVPRTALAAADAYGRARWGRLLGSLLVRPWELGALFALQHAFHAARRALREAAGRAGPRLLLPEAR